MHWVGQTGSVLINRRETRRPVKSKAVKVSVLDQILNPTDFTRLASVSGVSRSNQRIFKQNKFHLYEIYLLKKWNDDDSDDHLKFRVFINDQASANSYSIYRIFVSNVSQFF